MGSSRENKCSHLRAIPLGDIASPCLHVITFFFCFIFFPSHHRCPWVTGSSDSDQAQEVNFVVAFWYEISPLEWNFKQVSGQTEFAPPFSPEQKLYSKASWGMLSELLWGILYVPHRLFVESKRSLLLQSAIHERMRKNKVHDLYSKQNKSFLLSYTVFPVTSGYILTIMFVAK